jgi:hypothetical protein
MNLKKVVGIAASNMGYVRRGKQNRLAVNHDKWLERTDESIKKLKAGTKWKGRGKNQFAIIESLNGALVNYKSPKGVHSNMTADYFVYWYRPVED